MSKRQADLTARLAGALRVAHMRINLGECFCADCEDAADHLRKRKSKTPIISALPKSLHEALVERDGTADGVMTREERHADYLRSAGEPVVSRGAAPPGSKERASNLRV